MDNMCLCKHISSSTSSLTSPSSLSFMLLQIIITTIIWLLLPFFSHRFALLVNSQQIDCDILNPRCREHSRQMIHGTTLKSKTSRCLQKDIWLIPGNADASCC
ncbi:unnamed protein product [Brugia pahangi]|uniref:Secreted protein n=1 Tax=Brugia pahangi TaxID=6280 RepID=A0A0N4T8A3_BRUPA|nr:unnamed protein product [Brugia pahangi]